MKNSELTKLLIVDSLERKLGEWKEEIEYELLKENEEVLKEVEAKSNLMIRAAKEKIETLLNKFNSSTYDGMMGAVYRSRLTGQTTLLVQAYRLNTNARIVVANYHEKITISSQYGIPEKHIFTVKEISGLRGLTHGPLLYDNTAIIQMLHNIKTEVQSG